MTRLLDTRELYDVYRVEIQFADKLLGGIPRSPELIRGWLEARGMSDKIDETMSEVEMAEAEERAWCGFKVDPVRGHYIETRQVKALLKENAKVLGITQKQRGSKQILQHALFVFPDEDENPERRYDQDRIYLGTVDASGKVQELPNIESCGHVIGPQGPRSILKRNDYVEGITIAFRIHVLKSQQKFSEKDLVRTLALAQDGGLGASRSQGFGRFNVVKFEKLSD